MVVGGIGGHYLDSRPPPLLIFYNFLRGWGRNKRHHPNRPIHPIGHSVGHSVGQV